MQKNSRSKMFVLAIVATPIILSLVSLAGPVLGQKPKSVITKPHSIAKPHYSPASVECHISFRSKENFSLGDKILVLKPEYGEGPIHEQVATFRDFTIQCSYSVSPFELSTVWVAVIDTHTRRQIIMVP